MISFQKFRQNIILLFASLIFVSLAAEISLRLIIGTSLLTRSKNDSDFIQYDNVVKYIYKKNIKTEIKNSNYSIKVAINSFGYRDKEWDFKNSGVKILIIGDSYTAGFGIDVKKRWSNLLNKLLNDGIQKNNYNFYNAAVSGYNLEQMKLTADRLVLLINPNIIILGLTIDALDRINDPYVYFHGFSLKQSKVQYAQAYGDELYIHHFKNTLLRRIEYYPLKYSVLYNFIISKLIILKQEYISDKNRENDNSIIMKAEKILTCLNSQLKNRNIELIILPIIQHENEEKKFSRLTLSRYDMLKSYCGKNAIEMVNVLPMFEENLKHVKSYWIKDDPHWNEKANELAAEALFLKFSKVK